MAPTSAEARPAFLKDEKALCFHGELLYEAKVLEAKRTDPKDKQSPHEYRVHYKGWKNTWDDWVPQDRLRKLNDENKELAANLRRELAQPPPKSAVKPGKGRRGPGSDVGSDERQSSVPAGGRGTKRGRDMDIEKVGSKFSITFVTLDEVSDNYNNTNNNINNLNAKSPSPYFRFTSNQTKPSTVAQPTLAYVQPLKSTHTRPQPHTHPHSRRESPISVPDLQGGGTSSSKTSQRPRGARTIGEWRSKMYTIPDSADDSAGEAVTKHVLQKKAEQSPQKQAKRRNAAVVSKARQFKDMVTSDEDLSEAVDNILARNSSKPVAPKKAQRPLRQSQRQNPSVNSKATQFRDISNSDENLSENMDDVLARDPPPDEPEYISNVTFRSKGDMFFAPLIGSTTMDEKHNIEQELVAAGKLDLPERYHPGYVKTRAEDPSNTNRILFYEGQDPKRKIPIAGVSKEPVEIDPPGVGGPFDALKFPDRLVETLNNWPLEDLYGWNVQTLKLIPKEQMERVCPHALTGMPHEVLVRLPPSIHNKLPDNAPFFKGLPSNSKFKRQNQRVSFLRSHALAVTDPTVETEEPLSAETSGTVPQLDGPTSHFKTRTSCQASTTVLLSRLATPACANCKESGWKCNGKEPRCFACAKFGEECSFAYREVSGDLPSPPLSSLSTAGTSTPEVQIIEKSKSKSKSKKIKVNSQSPSNDNSMFGDNATTGKASSLQWNKNSRITRSKEMQMHDNISTRPSDSHYLLRQPTFTDAPNVQKPPTQFHDVDKVSTIKSVLKKNGPPDHNSTPFRGSFTYISFAKQEEIFQSRPSIRITIPDHLKNLLVDDWENVTKSLLLVPLPSKQPANLIIDTYFDEEKKNRRLGSAEADVLEEFCAGMKVYFEKSVGKILLYRFERGQLADIRKLWESGKYPEWTEKGPGDAYGAEHLTRMLVNMPEMIAQTNMDAQSVNRLREEISKFCIWLAKNSGRFFCAKYEKPTAEYIDNAR